MLVETGKIIKSYLESNNITVDDLIKVCSLSPRTIYRALNSETKLPYEIAKGIHTLIPEITPEFLLSYDGKYQAQKKQLEEKNGIGDINDLIKTYKLKYLFPEIKDNKNELLKKAIEIFGLKNLNDKTASTNEWMYSYNFSQAKNSDQFCQNIWLSSVYFDYCSNNDKLLFNEKLINESVNNIRQCCGTKDYNMTIYNMKEISKICGVNFNFKSKIPNSRIKAVTIQDKDGYIYLFISDLFKCIENLWISFMHEFIHIIKKDYENSVIYQDDKREYNEALVSSQVGTYFIGEEYKKIRKDMKIEEIRRISEKCKMPIGIIAELYRIKTNDYSNKEILKLIHYF